MRHRTWLVKVFLSLVLTLGIVILAMPLVYAQGPTSELTIIKEAIPADGTDFSFSQSSFLLKWGSLGSGDGQFSFPRGVAVDSADNVLCV